MDFVHKTDIGYLIVDQAKSREDSQRSRISLGTWIAFLTGACAGLEWKRNSSRPSLRTYHAVLVPVQYLRAGLLFAPVIQTASSFLTGTPTQGTLES